MKIFNVLYNNAIYFCGPASSEEIAIKKAKKTLAKINGKENIDPIEFTVEEIKSSGDKRGKYVRVKKEVPEFLAKELVGVMLPKWIVEKIKEEKNKGLYNNSEIVEKSLVKYYMWTPPKPIIEGAGDHNV
jgi:Arc/MetJ-type ribon-helix-helix transcriptional regulator